MKFSLVAARAFVPLRAYFLLIWILVYLFGHKLLTDDDSLSWKVDDENNAPAGIDLVLAIP